MLRKINHNDGSITICFADPNKGGPIIHAPTEKEAKEKFKKAFCGSIIIKNFLQFENNKFGVDDVFNMKKDFYSTKEELENI